MGIPGSAAPFLLAKPRRYLIERSLRFNSSDSAYLSRTPSTAGNRKTWTWAGWVKRSALVAGQLFSDMDATNTNGHASGFKGSEIDIWDYTSGGYNYRITSVGVFRDFSAWYHLVIKFDTTQSIPTDRLMVYVNGLEISVTGTYPPPDYAGFWNRATYSTIGNQGAVNTNYFNGYLADIHFIDGQALDPTSFGEFDANGIWQPKAYTGTYPGNSFHLDFADNSTTTSGSNVGIGKDISGNGNYWDSNNISVATGAGNDSVIDVPTNGTETDTGLGNEVRGNYCTFSPVDLTSGVTLSDGNLQISQSGAFGADEGICGAFGVGSGKWYWEIQPVSGGNAMVGIADLGVALSLRQYNDAGGLYYYQGTGGLYGFLGGSFINAAYGSGFPLTSDVVGIALDMDNGDVTFYKNGVSQGVANTSSLAGKIITPCLGNGGAAVVDVANFGQRPFAYTAPSGFKALCTANLPAPVVTKPSEYMDVKLYTGNGSTQTISGLEFSPDLVWIKNRAQADNHKLLDTVRGATEELESNTTDAEVTNADGLTAFNSDGFDLGADVEYNTSTEAYVAWAWDAGSSTVTNTDGSITSQVRANPSAGFSIVSYTGTGANATVGHGLGTAPAMLIVKCRDVGRNWNIGHSGIAVDAWTDYLQFTTAAATDLNTLWNDTPPTSSVFSLGTSIGVNGSTETHVAYCFAPVEGYSAFGSYTGNGSTDGPFVYTGFRPRWVMWKSSSTGGAVNYDWIIQDSARMDRNVIQTTRLSANTANSESSDVYVPIDFLSNGFKMRGIGAEGNLNNQTYIYAAFAENPFALNARAR